MGRAGREEGGPNYATARSGDRNSGRGAGGGSTNTPARLRCARGDGHLPIVF